VRVTGPPQVIANPAGGTPPSMSVFPGLGSLGSASGSGSSGGSGLSFDMPGQTAVFESAPLSQLVQVDGSMTVRIRVSGAAQATLFAEVYDVDQAGNATLPNSLAAPLRVDGAEHGATVTVQLPAIDYQFAAGHRMRLVLTTTDFAYATSPVPAVYHVALAGQGLSVPSDPALAVSGVGVTWWTPVAPAAALLAAALILIVGRRRRREALRIFGRQVHAGSAALSRLGAFVEGPGFLPHLSGRDNLDMYWRAAGRPAADAHAGEVIAIAGLGAAIDRSVRTYSRGMCQRLAIAQAMLGLPDLLVLDEPMNGLDPPQIREMRDVLLEYARQGRTVILSSHMLAEVEQTCSHVVVMHQGRRLAAGPVAEIIGDGAALIVGTPDTGRAVSVLNGLTGIGSATTHRDGVLVHPDGLSASDVVAALVGAGVPVERVMPNRRLEDAFLALIASPGGDQPAADGAMGDGNGVQAAVAAAGPEAAR